MLQTIKKTRVALIIALFIAAIILSFFSLPQIAYSDTDYTIGDTGPGGGKIFYIDETDAYPWDYLEVAPVDQGVSAWSNIDDVLIGTTESGLGTGQANTEAIIAQTGHTASAAKLCADYVSPTGYDDWYLPSEVELSLIIYNLSGYLPENDDHWSSTETRFDYAYRRDNYVSGDDYKYNSHYVRAIRAGTGTNSTEGSSKAEEESAEPAPWVRDREMTCYQVWVNEEENFEFVFFWEYANNNWIKIYDITSTEVFSIDMKYGNARFEADLPDGFYTVKTFHNGFETPIQEFLIGKP